jgi:hypothetical protein
MSSILKGLQLNELSNKKLGDYKKAAGADATAADKAGDYKRGDKRMSGIIKATKKEFANDEKKKDVAEAGMPFRGVGGAFNRGDDERHDLDPTEWYVVKDGKMYKTSVYPNQVQLAIAQGYSRSREEAKAKADRQGMVEEQLDELSCWPGHHRVAGTKAGAPGSCAKNKTNEENLAEGMPADNDMGVTPSGAKMTLGQWKQMWMKKMPNADFAAMFRSPPNMRGSAIAYFDGWMNNPDARWDPQQGVSEEQHSCPHCGGEMVSEELMNEKKDACYYKVKSRYKVWPSAYASGALVKCRKSGADSWGNGGKKNESSILEGIERADESLHDWFNKEKWVRMDTKGNIKGPCAREPGEGKPKCLPQSKAHSLGKKGRASAASRKRREDPNPERSGKAINVNTKKKSDESIDEGFGKMLGTAALAGSMALGAAGANARVTPDGQGGYTGGLKPTATQQATDTAPAKAEAPKGFSIEYLQKAADPNRFGRYMISVEKAQELLKQAQGQ